MKTDNAMTEAYKNKLCPHCKSESVWFWQKICNKCFVKLFEVLKKSL